ncbi:UDP-N-acetylmuramate--L-alanine ligase [Candidatus Chloroploca sp. M-50]|uniref:UDP-N-acetylmuramate--L-alanine ligase n=1 Tax=Candidatus Chloroploca mongolica TaxID=2528176 RepID=A0ABS4D561_9CHLR|nr:UDP-N-acetylmuramate--L-alanine ligase [Candidatus Chloroploca mongolica]MBP1464576.1 UDP-N-acetylmuramate--L-alanine ligase [Candidatus Chloroploca mongolica]
MHYHLVGIAGTGFSALANLLLDQGHTVSGSDRVANRQTAALIERGATIYLGHSPAYVQGADALVATAAVTADHCELEAARAAGVPVLSRADLWRDWSAQRRVIAIAGTHGKTTTSAMVAVALRAAGVPAGYLIGAEVPELGGNAAWGDPETPLVIEADEYAQVFLALSPDVAVITNVEWDHPDCYPDASVYHETFAQFAAAVAKPQRVILCGDDQGAMSLGLHEAALYGIEERLATDPVSCRLAPFDWTASGVQTNKGGGVTFDLWRYDRRRMAQRRLGTQNLRLSGLHNVRNALAALAVVAMLEGDLAAASAALANFGGALRRFEQKGEACGVLVIDDYAHHPTAVQATLSTARAAYPGRRLIAYLQPHTFSRTTALSNVWTTACAAADIVLVGDVYAAREEGDATAASQELAARMAATGLDVHPVGSLEQALDHLGALVQAGDLVVTMGAGDSSLLGVRLLERLRCQEAD